ncbi:amino acid transporter [Ktedonobacteria bacterium brp13]|nr:amino acid transporter [Ktedonobacteria bacterium brp13]
MPQPLYLSLVQGFALGASLIIAIGAQNAFVLRQGLKKQHLFLVASLCTLCDIILIILGIAGLGTLITAIPALTLIATWGGALFLIVYGLRSFRSAFKHETLTTQETEQKNVRKRDTVLAILGFSLLNPHVYLDTVVLIGSIGAHYHAQARIFFALGTMLASLLWFFSLAYGAGKLAPLFRHSRAWQVLDILIGCVMWIIAGTLINSGLHI